MSALFQTDPGLRNRILYGTDWFMLVRAKDYSSYRANFESSLQLVTGGSVTDEVMGQNAAAFLGLASNQATRGRLDTFYTQHGLQPCWTSMI